MIITFVMSVLLSLFSTIVMSYISMATPIGPWIAPTLLLLGMLIMKALRQTDTSNSLALMTASGSVGGILATAFGFSFPTLYFLDPSLFNSWMETPVYFACVVAGLAFISGIFGLVIANMLEHRLIIEDGLAFPIGQLVYKMIAAGRQVRKSYELMGGFLATALFYLFREGVLLSGKGLIPKTITVIAARRISVFSIPIVQFDLWPMLWAIGFVTGHVIAVPLAVGALARVILVDPVHISWFSWLSSVEFVLAFCSGMVLYGAVMSFTALPAMLRNGFKTIMSFMRGGGVARFTHGSRVMVFEWGVAIAVCVAFLAYFGLPLLAQLFLLIATAACAYQIAFIAGKIGIAPLGRFATFVMVPAMFLFPVDYVQLVFIATFVEAACGVTADILFGRKMAQLAGIGRTVICRYQFLGLVVSCIALGIVFWFLINHLHLGSTELFAAKAQSRQLLIHAKQFDYYVLLIGALFSALLQWVKVNPTLVLGGLLMPINMSVGLIFGGMLTLLCKNREDWEPFWSGVFASDSLIVLIKAVVG